MAVNAYLFIDGVRAQHQQDRTTSTFFLSAGA